MIPRKLPPLPPIRDLIRVYGLSADQKFSQNFILDKNVTDTIAQHAKISVKDDLIVEVGPGPGLLTRSILDAGARRVVVVEKDPRFLPTLQQLAEASDHRLGILMGDMLKMDHTNILKAGSALHSRPTDTSSPQHPIPVSVDNIDNDNDNTQDRELQRKQDQKKEDDYWKPMDERNSTIRLLGNLPFGIASPLLVQWLKMMALQQGIFCADNRVSMTLMFQKEVAQGIVAPPSHPQRSRLSVIAQALCNVKMAYKLPSGVFVPKPKVDAAVVHFEKKDEPLVSGSLEKLEDVARFYFNKRRKTMGHNTNRMAKAAPEVKPILDEWVAEGGWDMNMRTQDVSTEQFCALARKLDRAQIKIPLT
ncbi:Dimethyladenosine transferase 1, mitochondrial [Mortierella alpina]|nr:Dimethyladenosine transferase 1, mitochondrial [Mortierella alpina]